jgi:hypothetical protein
MYGAKSEEVGDKEIRKVCGVVSLNENDVAYMVFGKLDANRYPAPDSLFAKAFMRSKICSGYEKVRCSFVLLLSLRLL